MINDNGDLNYDLENESQLILFDKKNFDDNKNCKDCCFVWVRQCGSDRYAYRYFCKIKSKNVKSLHLACNIFERKIEVKCEDNIYL